MKKNSLVLLFVLFAKFSFSQDYSQGIYYTQDGQRVEGLIQHVFFAKLGEGPDNFINFKATADAKKVKLTTKDIRSFKISSDSFIILTDFKISSDVHYKEDFVKIAVLGKLNLYLHYTTGITGFNVWDASTPILETNGELMALSTRVFKSNYKKLFAGNNNLIKKIEDKILAYTDIVIIIKEYNDWYKAFPGTNQ